MLSSSPHLQEWNAHLLPKLSFTPSESGSLSFCPSKWTWFHLWWVLGWSLLSWPTISLCFHCSPPSQRALGPVWKCSRPFWSHGGEKERRCCDASEKGGQCSLRDTRPVHWAFTFCWAVFTRVLQRPLFLQLFLVEGQDIFGKARARSEWGAA